MVKIEKKWQRCMLSKTSRAKSGSQWLDRGLRNGRQSGDDLLCIYTASSAAILRWTSRNGRLAVLILPSADGIQEDLFTGVSEGVCKEQNGCQASVRTVFEMRYHEWGGGD